MPVKPKIWTMTDIPTPQEMEAFLARVRDAREAMGGTFEFPPLPPDMNKLTFEEANDIERLLLVVDETIDKMKKAGFSPANCKREDFNMLTQS